MKLSGLGGASPEGSVEKTKPSATTSTPHASDVHLHSLRHFQSTRLDTVISEAQKQARMGWASVHMSRHYTDAITEEDRRAAEHIGEALGESADGGEPLRRSAVRFRP